MPTRLFRYLPDNEVNTSAGEPKRKQNCNHSIDAKDFSLRDDHIVLLAIDCLLALHAKFENWRRQRRTLRALAQLDEHQLRDVGLTRGKTIARSHLEA
jgi:uncharacterized protein DUF1127